MDGIAVRAVDTVGASPSDAAAARPRGLRVVDTGDPLARRLRRRGHARARAPRRRRGRAARGRRRPTSTCARSARTSARPSCCCPRATGCGRWTSPPPPRPASRIVLVHRRPVVAILPTGDEIRPLGADPGRGEILDTNSLMLAGQAREAGCETWRCEIAPRRPRPHRRGAARRGRAERSGDRRWPARAPAATTTPPRVVDAAGTLAVHGVAVRPGHPVVLGAVDETPVLGAPGYPVSAALTFDIFAAPLLAALEGVRADASGRGRGRGWPASSPRPWAWTTGCACASAASATSSSRRRCRAVPACSRRSCVPTGCWSSPPAWRATTPGELVDVALLRGVGEIDRTIVAVGSHDLVLDLAASAMRAADPRATLASSNVGSLGGLVALRDGLCHLAGSHLLDPESGEYTLPYVDRVLDGRDVAVVRLVHRDQGLIVAAGNPLGLDGLDDLDGPVCATSTASAAPGPACCSMRSSAPAALVRPRSPAMSARSTPTSRSRRRSRAVARTAGSACSPRRARSAWASCR